MKNRIIQIRKGENLSQEEFAERLGLSRNFINQVENGKKNLSDRSIADICSKFDINEEFIRTGNGEMKKELSRSQEISEFMKKVLKESDNSFRKRFCAALAKLDERDWETIGKIVEEMEKEG